MCAPSIRCGQSSVNRPGHNDPGIRVAATTDLAAILDVHRAAFGTDEEADLVRLMMRDLTAEPLLSLVHEEDGRLVGHVLFSRVTIDGAPPETRAQILAPLAVRPEGHGKGIGGGLVREGLKRLAEAGTDLVFVYGDPNYYGRFGFEPALPHGLPPPNAIPDDHQDGWRVHTPGGTPPRVSGRVQCCDVLNRPEYW